MKNNKIITILTATFFVVVAWNATPTPMAIIISLIAVGIAVAHTVFGIAPNGREEDWSICTGIDDHPMNAGISTDISTMDISSVSTYEN